MRDFLRKLFRKQPEVALQAHPVQINPGTGIRVERNNLRLARLESALAGETDKKRRASLEHEIARRRQFGR
jgi:hypothetical protein